NAPTAIMGKAKVVIENLTPSKATIQPVLVVPILAHIITPIAWEKLNTPAPTKPIVASVVAVEDCTIKVKPIPEHIDLNGVPVNLVSHSRKVSPAMSLRLSVLKIMPIKDQPLPPQSSPLISSTISRECF